MGESYDTWPSYATHAARARERSRVVHTRITEEQFQKLRQEAEKQGITVGHLIRRKLTKPETSKMQPLRPYTPKHGRRIRLTSQQRKAIAEKYIEEYPQLLKRTVQQVNPETPRTPPKTMEELAQLVARDTMETQISIAEVHQDVIKTMREAVQRRFKRKQKGKG